MKVFLKVVAAILLLGAAELLLFAILYKEEPIDIQNIADVNISDLDRGSTVYIDEVYVMDRYAFETIHEYKEDHETGYAPDPVYFVYEGWQPMDKHELFAEYYIVKFTDQSGKEYIASMSVLANKSYSPSLKNLPQKISAVTDVGIPSATGNTSDNSNTAKLFQWRAAALDEYEETLRIPQAGISLGYRAENISHLQELQQREDRTFRILGIAGGTIFLVVGIVLLIKPGKKSQSAKAV